MNWVILVAKNQKRMNPSLNLLHILFESVVRIWWVLEWGLVRRRKLASRERAREGIDSLILYVPDVREQRRVMDSFVLVFVPMRWREERVGIVKALIAAWKRSCTRVSAHISYDRLLRTLPRFELVKVMFVVVFGEKVV